MESEIENLKDQIQRLEKTKKDLESQIATLKGNISNLEATIKAQVCVHRTYAKVEFSETVRLYFHDYSMSVKAIYIHSTGQLNGDNFHFE